MAHRSALWSQMRATAALTFVALVALVIAAAPLTWRSCTQLNALLNYPYPNDPLEGTLLHEARLLQAGESLYQPLEPHRFVSAPYPPLHPLVLAQADRYQGNHIMRSGRLVSLLSALLVVLLIVWIARASGGSMLAGMVSGAVFLGAPPVLLWATRIKPDLFCMALVCLGLLLAVATLAAEPATRAGAWLTRYGPALAAMGFVLALFTRQTAVIAPFATGLALLVADLRTPLSKQRLAGIPVPQRSLTFGCTYAVLAASIWLLLDWFTGGQYTAHVWGLHRSEWWSFYLVEKYLLLLVPYWPLALLTIAVVLRAYKSDAALVPAFYAPLAPISLLGAAEIGANHNHLLETILALCVAAGVAITALQPLYQLLPLVALLAVQLNLAYQPQPWFAGEIDLGQRAPPERFLHFMRHTPGEILADDVGLLLFAQKPVRYDDPSTMGPAAVSGVWDQRGLIDDIVNQRFSAIMIPEDVDLPPYDNIGRWTAEVRAAIKAHYQPKFRDRIRTYVPR